MKDKILNFIKHFKGSEDTFLHGCCYWFAWILWSRFMPFLRIVYEPIEGHFLVESDVVLYASDEFGHCFYDIRGDVTELYKDKKLYTLNQICSDDFKWYSRLMRDCRDFITPED